MLGYHNSFNGSTIVEILRSPAEHTPNQIVYTFLLDGESTEAHLTYGELDQKARAIGSRLTTMGVSQQHALLIYPPGLDYITAFFGCLYANVVAVPIYPPRLNRSLLRLQTIMTDSQATIALTTSSILASIQPQHTKSPPLEHLHWLATDQPDIGHASEWSFRAIKPDSLAFLQHAIDCLKIVPSHLKALLVSSRPEQVLPCRRLVLGGEGTPWDLVETVQRLAPDCRIINHYGPTETTVGVLTHWLSSSVSQHQTLTLLLRQVIDNTQVYVLDNSLQLTPIGVPGELCVGGAALARGYLHQPAQTSEKFIADPFSQIPGGRLYKTGDLARYLPDGSLEILARVDDQVKFHGYRVELGEIRQALNQHILIYDSVIILHKDQHQRETLAAYYLAKQELDSIELRKFLAQSILEETLPNTFIHLTHIPLTANGKIDRQALPSIEEARQKSTRSFVAPRTPTEIALAAIWSQILGIEQIGIYDGFFTLGGDSILGIQIIAKANQAGIHLRPKQLFQYQTIAELAAVANTRPAIQAEQGLVIGSVPLTPKQRWFFEQEFRDPEKWNITIVMEAQEHLEPTMVEQAFRCLLRQHDVLRLQLTQQGQTVEAALVTGDESIAFRYVDLTGTPELAQVDFRYAGQFNSLAGLPYEILDQHEPDMPTRHYQLAINIATFADRLEIGWWYSKQTYDQSTVERLSQNFITTLSIARSRRIYAVRLPIIKHRSAKVE